MTLIRSVSTLWNTKNVCPSASICSAASSGAIGRMTCRFTRTMRGPSPNTSSASSASAAAVASESGGVGAASWRLASIRPLKRLSWRSSLSTTRSIAA